MHARRLLHQDQTQSGAGVLPTQAAVNLHERLEQLAHVFAADANPCVPNREHDPMQFPVSSDQ